jgi:hypothetical protein
VRSFIIFTLRKILPELSVISRMRNMRNTYKITIVKPEEKRPFRRPRRRWEDNIKMDLITPKV